jgi:hypothetical protein
MKISTLAVVVAVITVTWPFGATLGQTQRHQQAADIPPGLLAALQNDLKNDLEETKSCLDREGLSWDQGVRVTRFNLNRSRQAWFVEGLGPCLAGNANGPKFLYLRDGQDWRTFFMMLANRWRSAAAPICHALSLKRRGSQIEWSAGLAA